MRRTSASLVLGAPTRRTRPLTGGADVVFDCVGSAESLAQCLAMVRPRGRIVLVGMPGKVHVDLASLWQREVELVGAYAYGTEHVAGAERPNGSRRAGAKARVRTFDLAFEIVDAHRLGRLVSASYPIDRFEEALAHAGAAGRRGAVKIVFDLRGGDRRAWRSTREEGGTP